MFKHLTMMCLDCFFHSVLLDSAHKSEDAYHAGLSLVLLILTSGANTYR